MHPDMDAPLMFIPQEALSNPPPEPWIDGLNASGRIIYKNLETHMETETHPLEEQLKRLFLQEKARFFMNQSHVQAQQIIEASVQLAVEKAQEIRAQAQLHAKAKEAQLSAELFALKKQHKLELAQKGQQQKEEVEQELVMKISSKHQEKTEKLRATYEKRIGEVREELRRQLREEARQAERQTEAMLRAERENMETVNRLETE